MYNLIECISNYSNTTCSLWFYSKKKANTDNFKSFKYKVKLSGNTVAQPNPNQANGILENPKIAVPLKCLSNLWESL